jgi:predicted nuclease of restriction endonuclease-like (RecB) superfamily
MQKVISKRYLNLIREISGCIRTRRYFAARSVNRESLLLYYQTGKLLAERIAAADWGDSVLETISLGIQNNFPGIRGFSISNLKNMRQFYMVYSEGVFGQLLTGQIDKRVISRLPKPKTRRPRKSQLSTGQIENNNRFYSQEAFFQIGFTHHILLLQKCSSIDERNFYIQQAGCNQWSVEILRYHIASNLYRKKGNITSNFSTTLPTSLKKYALESFRDEYLLNFINVKDTDSEEVLENELVTNLKDFLMSLGREFAFLGNQYRVIVDGDEFFIDLLFYHRRLQSLIAIDLKTGKFKPEYAGKMNFYLEALDQYVKLDNERPSIGIILCSEKKNTVVEFAFKRVDRPMGVATYVYSDKLPVEYRKYLPSPKQLKKAAFIRNVNK